MPACNSSPTVVPSSVSRCVPWASRAPTNAMAAPAATSTSDSQNVLYCPISGMATAATAVPSTGRPPVNMNQNHPAAVARSSRRTARLIQVRKAKANIG